MDAFDRRRQVSFVSFFSSYARARAHTHPLKISLYLPYSHFMQVHTLFVIFLRMCCAGANAELLSSQA